MKTWVTLFLFITASVFSGCDHRKQHGAGTGSGDKVNGRPNAGDKESFYRPGKALLEDAYETFREETLSRRDFKHRDIEPLIREHDENGVLSVSELGRSAEQRSVYQLTYGKGPVTVMLWSQMHGDESTATMALFDLFNFLEGTRDGFDTLRHLLSERTTLYFIPMLNPDGAEIFTRRNAYGFDINRDAVKGETPEGRILRRAREAVEPDFGFNLHDQSIYYNVKGTPVPATISVLAPAFDEAVSMNEVRKKSMQVILGMNELLQQYIPGGVGKYDDSFYPRAFGDNFQKWGTSTILIESGGYKGDPEKQFIRKLNFMVILNALNDIATGSYQTFDHTRYAEIPDNDNQLNDLVIRNLEANYNGQRYQTDVAVRQGRSTVTRDASSVTDLGDLSVLYGYDELDASGLRWQAGKVYEKTFASAAEISREEALSLLREGYCAARVASAPQPDSLLPLLLIHGKKATLPNALQHGGKATFLISEGGRPRYAVIRGQLIKL